MTEELLICLKTAICYDDINIIHRVMFIHGMDTVLRCIYQNNLYLFMAYKNSINIYGYLLQNDSELARVVNTSGGISPLHLVSSNDMLRLLLENGANPNIMDSVGDTPILMIAASLTLEQKTKANMIDTIIRYGANVNDYNQQGDRNTVMHRLLQCSHHRLILDLLWKDIRFDVRNRVGCTVIDLVQAFELFQDKDDNREAILRVMKYSGVVSMVLYCSRLPTDLVRYMYINYL